MAPAALNGRVALVTGGAGGIGSEICRHLAHAGATVLVGYNSSPAAAEDLVAELPPVEGQHAAIATPVTDSQGLDRLARVIAESHGKCDILVNSAGTTRFVAHADLDGLDDELIDRILATNVRGPFATLRALRGLLLQSDAALVVNISSIAGVTANGSNVMYCASKAALDNMTKSLARALAPRIRVMSVAPGLVDTDFISRLDTAWRDEQVRKTPLNALALPADVARAVVACATSLTFTTGAVIPVDGGRPLA
jgi:3-oxoacyl-[acyl-carrier protein] reductase